MLHQQSPWLFELKKNRTPYVFGSVSDQHDLVVVGGGIAGVMTAYYLLTLTNKEVTLLERNNIASGATGHNAGQIVTYFERPFEEIVKEYGEELAREGQADINSAWDLLEEIKQKLELKTPMYIFEGLSGCTSITSVSIHLQNRFLRSPVPHQNEFCLVANDCPFLDQIPKEFADLYTIVPRKIILDLLETDNPNYCAVFTSKKGCMNSAMFCEEVVAYLVKKYPTRFRVSENTFVSEITLTNQEAHIKMTDQTLTAKKVILCTNGFKGIKIINRAGPTISTEFHDTLRGKIGFMKAYTFKDEKKPTAISYYNKADNEYFYLTRRPSTFSKDQLHNLIAIGGPEYFLADKHEYKPDMLFPEKVLTSIDRFIEQTRINEFKEHYEHEFIWHGLMGYTKKGIRLIGPEIHNHNLLYNLGCNGVGILPSIFGGKKIALFINNKVHKKSIFDPTI